MKKLQQLAQCLAVGIVLLGGLATSPAKAEEGGGFGEISATFGVYTDYVFRGFTQTSRDAAIQGSLDWSHDSGFYLGVWGSNLDFGPGDPANADLELDFYGGWAGEFGMFSVDVGVVYFYYPGTPGALEYDYVEFGGSVGVDFGFMSVSVGGWYSPDFFGGAGDAFYMPIDFEIPIPIKSEKVALTLSGGVGHQWLTGPGDYWNWNLGMTVSITDWFDLDFRYHDTDVTMGKLVGADSAFVFSVSRGF